MSLVVSITVAQTPGSSFVTGSKEDEAAIRAIVSDTSEDRKNAHIAADLDWENAFGIRYFDLKKRDAFFGAIVKPLQKNTTSSELEVKVRFVTTDVAVADEYWHVVGQLDMETRKPGPDRWGRTTYVFTKRDGVWTEVLERVADLRYAYYKHYDQLPAAVAVPRATLEAYAGNYEFDDDKSQRMIAVEGDHLTVASTKHLRVAIPVSPTDFLVFDPGDLAEYIKLHFETDGAGKTTAAVSDEVGDEIGKMIKTK
ncbi:MAG TPA: hypothetical protein VGD64_06680 [Acidisarcina sp.]